MLFVFASCDIVSSKLEDIRLPFQDEEKPSTDTNDPVDDNKDDGNTNQGDNNQGNNNQGDNNQGNAQTPDYSSVIFSATIDGAMPSNLTYITNNSQYPDPEFYSDGGLKMRFTNQGVKTAQFSEQYAVRVYIIISALNENTKTDAAGVDAFTVYALDKNGNTVATATLNTLTAGDNNTVTLIADGIVAVKVVMTDYPFNGSKSCNVSLGGIKIEGKGTGTGSGSGSGSGSGTGSGSGSGSTSHTYTDFTSSEKSLMNTTIGFVIPFLPNNDYVLEEYDGAEYGYDGEYGVYFCTEGNTSAEFDAYLDKFASYSDDGTQDDEGDTWYFFSKGDVYVDVIYYNYNGTYYVELYAYVTDGGSDSGSDSGNTGSGSGSGSGSTNSDVITNAGAGLPSDADGVYDVDFRKAENVKDVTDQGYYLDGCPTTGSPAVLVIPVQFPDVTAASKGYSTATLAAALGKNGQTDYYSLYDYYYISSYGQLTLDITVLDFWFTPKNNSSYYYNATYEYYGDDVAIGDQLVLDEALAYLATIYDLSDYDSDNNGIIDSVILVNTLEIGEEDFYWAYRYWNIYTDDDGYYYEYDDVSANDYVWLSYQFLYEGYDASGNVVYDSSNRNTYTFIHEFAHVLGVDDYYDTSNAGNHPLEDQDIMDSMTGDHNAYTKFNLGWITTSRLVVTSSSVTLTLEDFSKNGDTIIIANNWDEKLGAYQEYYVLMYYKNTGLNAGDDAGYFERDGVVVYHVNASLYKEVYDDETHYDVYNNNTDPSDQYGTEDNLVEFVKSQNGTFTYIAGDKLPTVTDDQGNVLSYTFTVDSISDDCATITFTRK